MSQTPRDPRQPFGAAPRQTPTTRPSTPHTTPSDAYAPPPSRAPWLIAAIAVLATIAIAALVLTQGDRPVGTPSASSTATGPIPQASRVTPTTGTGVEWVHSNSKGYWRLFGEKWEGNTVTLDVQVECTEGDLNWDFMSYPDSGESALDANSSGDQPYIGTGHCQAGEKVRGYVSFTYEGRSGGSIILATSLTAISGLRIKG